MVVVVAVVVGESDDDKRDRKQRGDACGDNGGLISPQQYGTHDNADCRYDCGRLVALAYGVAAWLRTVYGIAQLLL